MDLLMWTEARSSEGGGEWLHSLPDDRWAWLRLRFWTHKWSNLCFK